MEIDQNNIVTLITNTNLKLLVKKYQYFSVHMATAVMYLVNFEKGQDINVSLILVSMR